MQGASKEELKQTKNVKKKKVLFHFSLEEVAKPISLAIVQLVEENCPATLLCCVHLSHVLPQFPIFAVRKMSKKEIP